jgi:small subunit ribosomal protein S13
MADNPKAEAKAPAKEQKGDKPEKAKEAPKGETKKMDFGPDFRYLVRIVNTDLDGKKPFAVALTYVPGVSNRMANIVARESGVDPKVRIGTLKEDQLARVVEAIENLSDMVPVWMLNRRNDVETGEDRHMVGSEITIMLREDLNRLKKIRSWRGHRHDRKLPTRGQRTKNNGRFGGAVGVQRKDVGAAPTEGEAAAAPAKAGGGGAKPLGGAKPAAAAAPAAAGGAKPAAGAAKPAAPAAGGAKPAAAPAKPAPGGKK